MRNEQDMPLPSTVTNNMGYPTTVDTGQVQPWIIDSIATAAGTTNGALVANTVYLWAFELYVPCTITALRWRMGATATGNADLGIYDANGNLLGHTGSSANTASTDNTANLLASLTLASGRYYLALSPGNSTDTYTRLATLLGGSTVAINRSFSAANGSTGATSPVLPATTGVISPNTTMPVVSGIVSGGIP